MRLSMVHVYRAELGGRGGGTMRLSMVHVYRAELGGRGGDHEVIHGTRVQS